MTSFLLVPYSDESAAAQINNKRNTSRKKTISQRCFHFQIEHFPEFYADFFKFINTCSNERNNYICGPVIKRK